ncbi:MAG: serine hydrolase, partial [Bacteroidota bacterium]
LLERSKNKTLIDMKKYLYCFLLLALPQLLFTQELYFPPSNSMDWDTLAPEALNYCPEKIEALYQFLEAEQSKSFLLLKDGKIVLEQYFGTFTQDSLWFWFSAGKGLRAVLVGIAQEQGFLDINDPTSDYLGSGWTSMTPEQELLITPWHQLTMTSSLNPIDFTCTDPSCLTYLQDAGSFWVYHNSPYNLLRNVLESATGVNINVLTNNWIRNKIGMNSGFWLPSGDNTFFLSRARDMARFGLLVQNRGNWDGTTILGDTAYLDQMLNTSQSLNLSYGYLWWLNGKDSYIPPGSLLTFSGYLAPDAPADIVTAAGGQGQYISISPGSGLMMIRQGLSEDEDRAAIELLNAIWEKILDLECMTTSVSEQQTESIQITPNPVSDWLQVQGLRVPMSEIWLYDVNGQLKGTWTNQSTISLQAQAPGVYYLRIKNGDEYLTKKLVKT